MKRFIYLDTDMLNSFLAQIKGGIIDSYIQETERSSNDSMETSRGDEGILEGKLNAVIASGNAKVLFSEETVKKSSNNEIIKDVTNKRIHDYAFNELMEYLNTDGTLKEQEEKIGKFILEDIDFEFVDYDFINKLFEKNGIIDFLKEESYKKLDETSKNQISQNLNREQTRNASKELQNIINQEKKKIDDEYSNSYKIFNMIFNVIPYKRIIKNENKLFITNDKYFRDDLEMLSFKYGGTVKILGYITNIIVQNEQSNNINQNSLTDVLKSMNSIINQSIITLVGKDNKLVVIHPVAIYYE